MIPASALKLPAAFLNSAGCAGCRICSAKSQVLESPPILSIVTPQSFNCGNQATEFISLVSAAGAYTARCVGGVLALCGVPRTKNGAPIKLTDVADVVDDAENLRQAAWMNDVPAVILNC